MTAQKEEFTYLDQLPGLKLDIVPTCSDEQWADYLVTYLKNYSKNIDVLFLFGMYNSYYPVAKFFKEHYQGKIILKADANSDWVNNSINPNLPWADYLIKNCDIISCEGSAMQTYLSKKWQRQIELIRNGSLKRDFNPELSAKIKDKVIINVGSQEVGRKNTPLLIKAFMNLCFSWVETRVNWSSGS